MALLLSGQISPGIYKNVFGKTFVGNQLHRLKICQDDFQWELVSVLMGPSRASLNVQGATLSSRGDAPEAKGALGLWSSGLHCSCLVITEAAVVCATGFNLLALLLPAGQPQQR